MFFPIFFRLFSLLLLFFYFFIFLLLLLNTNFLFMLMEYSFCAYKLEFNNLICLLAFDGLTLYFSLLTLLLFFVCILLIWNLKYKLREFLLVLFVINLLLIAIFGLIDLFFFYVFFESLLIPMFLLIGIWGSRERKINAAYQFFFYTLFGSVFLLIAIFFLYSHYGSTDFRVLSGFSVTLKRQLFFWLIFFFAVAVKVPMFPVHIWLPEAHVEAPTAGSIVLAGILLKLGLFALFKFAFPIFSWASIVYAPLVLLLAIIAVIYASCSTFSQNDMKKLVAYSSVAHMNFAVLGMFSFNFYGFVGCVMLMLSHGLVSSGLFLAVGFLYDRYKTRLFLYFGGLIQLMPIFSILFFILVLANMSFPGTASFVGELLIFFGLISINFVICFLSTLTMFFSAVYSLSFYNHILLAGINPLFVKYFSDLSKREFCMLFSLVFLVGFFGIFPSLIILPLESVASLYLDMIVSFLYA